MTHFVFFVVVVVVVVVRLQNVELHLRSSRTQLPKFCSYVFDLTNTLFILAHLKLLCLKPPTRSNAEQIKTDERGLHHCLSILHSAASPPMLNAQISRVKGPLRLIKVPFW